MYLSLDTEVPGLHRTLKPFMVSACDENGKARLWEWPVDQFTRSVDVNGIDLQEIRDYLTGHEIVFHHAQYDLNKLANAGLRLQTDQWIVPESSHTKHSITARVKAIHDTMLASHLVDSRGVYRSQGNEVKSTHALKELCLVRLGVSDLDEILLRKAVARARVIGKSRGWKIGQSVDEDYWLPKAVDPKSTICRDYALRDVRERTMMLFLTAKEILQADGRWDMYLEETQLLPIFYSLEETGLRVDPVRIAKQRAHHQDRIEFHEFNMMDLSQIEKTGKTFPSDGQLRKLLFTDWNLGSTKKTAKKQEPCVDARTLEELRDYLAYHLDDDPDKDHKKGLAYEFLNHLIGSKNYETEEVTPGCRQHLKMLGYLDFYSRESIADYFHATIYPVGTGTTRISTEGSQNIGKKKVDGVSCRSAFGPAKDEIWVSIDYEQLELRIFARLANDQSLIAAFENGYDFHSFVATKIFNLPPEEISGEQRRIAKNTNFAIIFGGSPWRVDLTAGMKGAYDAFSKQFPSVKSFMESTINEVRRNGFISTVDGYPLYAPPGEPFKGTDYRVQGTAGRIIKLAMKWLFYGRKPWIRTDGHGNWRQDGTYLSRCQELPPIIDWDKIKMVVQIHDELVFSISTKGRSRYDIVRVVRQIMRTMEEAGQALGVVTPVEGSIHLKDWGQKISVKEYLNGRHKVSNR